MQIELSSIGLFQVTRRKWKLKVTIQHTVWDSLPMYAYDYLQDSAKPSTFNFLGWFFRSQESCLNFLGYLGSTKKVETGSLWCKIELN